MAKIRFETGQVVNFEGTPSQADIDEVAASFSKPKPMFANKQEADAGMDKAKREQAEAEMYTGPLGNLALATKNSYDPMVNSAAFGLPDLISKKVTGKPFVREDAQSKLLSEGAGMIAGGPGRLAVGAGKLAVPVVKSGIKMTEHGIPTVVRDTMKKKMARGAVEGAVAGGTTLTSDEQGNVDPLDQVGQAVGGSLIGASVVPAASLAGQFISKSGHAYKRFARWRKGDVDKAKQVVEGKVAKDKQAVEMISAKRGAEQRQLGESFEANLQQTKADLQENFDSLTKEFQEAGETGSIKMQDGVKFVTREMSDNYGSQFDEIADSVNYYDPIANNEISSLIDGVKSKLQDNLITSGHVNDILSKMESKYGEKFIGGSGFRAFKTPRSNAKDAIDFKKFIKDVKSIKKGIKYGGKTEDNVALGIFYDDLTNFLGQRPGLEKYLELNSAYAPYIQSLKELTRQTKAYVGDSSTKSSTELLKRFGLRKADVPSGKGVGTPAEASEVRNIERLQQPSQFSRGMGTQSTDPVVAKAKELYEAKSAMDNIDTIMKDALKADAKVIDKRFIGELDNIMATKNYIEGDYLAKEAMIKDAIRTKLKRIGYQENKINFILEDRKKLPNIIKRFMGGAVLTSGFAGGAVYGLNALRGGR